MDWTFWVSAAKDFAAVVGPLGLVVIGALGLGAWHKQLAGTTKYQLAKCILTTSYRVQDAIQAVRNPMLYLSNDAVNEDQRLQEEQRVYGERLPLCHDSCPLF